MPDREKMHEARRRREQVKADVARDFGRWLDSAMNERGMANVDLQDLIGINNSTIGFWRRGVRIPDDWSALRALADVFETPATQLAVLIGLFRPEELGGVEPPADLEATALEWLKAHPARALDELYEWIQRHPRDAMAKVMAPIMGSAEARREMGIRDD